jgi:hypothetical protein
MLLCLLFCFACASSGYVLYQARIPSVATLYLLFLSYPVNGA